MKGRVNKAYDPENLKIRAFRLDSASSNDGEDSTDNSSPESNDRTQAMVDIRNQWGDFSQRIMGVQI